MKNKNLFNHVVLLAVLAANPVYAEDKATLAAATGDTTNEKVTRVTITTATTRDLEVVQKSVGLVESLQAPKVASEISARLITLKVDVGDFVKKGQLLAVLDDKDLRLQLSAAKTDVKRLKALIDSQQKEVERQRNMVGDKFSSQSLLDQAQAQLLALQQQYAGAKIRVETARYNLSKHRILSPVDGQVQSRLVSVGDFVRNGTVLFQIVALNQLRVLLPFPETLLSKIKPGQEVRLRTATDYQLAHGTVREIRPMVNKKNKAISVIVDVQNPGQWRPGATVTGELILDKHSDAVMVPETAVVMRPIGKVVYVIEDERARQRLVTTGIRKNGSIEIVNGLGAGETVAVDGAGFLVDNALVQTQRTAQ